VITSAGLACWEDGGRQAGRVHTPRSYTGGGRGNAWIAARAGRGHEGGMKVPYDPARGRIALASIQSMARWPGQGSAESFHSDLMPGRFREPTCRKQCFVPWVPAVARAGHLFRSGISAKNRAGMGCVKPPGGEQQG